MGGGVYIMHYTKEQWKTFMDHKTETSLHNEMHKHMDTCDECLSMYLDFIEKEQSIEALIPAEFTNKTMNFIKAETTKLNTKRQKQKRINLIIYYASAASITLFLCSTGVFKDIASIMNHSKTLTANTSFNQSLFISGWTDKLTDETSKIINSLEKKK
jgi:hypothetical protein